MSRFPAKDAARALLRHLLQERDGMVRFKILRALNRLASENPGLALDRGVLKQAVQHTLAALFELSHWHHVLHEGLADHPERATPGHELLKTLLHDKEIHGVERLFRLLGLLYRGENFENIHRGVLSPDARLRASSRELLEGVLRPPLREAVLSVVDAAPWPERAAVAGAHYQPLASSYEDLLSRLLSSPSETVRSLAAHHVAELGLTRLRPALEARRSQETALFVGRVLEKALRLLDRPPQGALGHAG
jgi:HEAT repeat protein